jgi:hypothetical protein
MRHERSDDKSDLPPRACSTLAGRAPLATLQPGLLTGAISCGAIPFGAWSCQPGGGAARYDRRFAGSGIAPWQAPNQTVPKA